MFAGSRVRWTIVIAILVGVAYWGFGRALESRDTTEITTMGVSVTPMNVEVTRSSSGGPSLVKFTLKNTSAKSVAVKSVSTSCGCSVARPMSDPTVRPGLTQSLVFSTEPPQFGSRNVHVTLELADLTESGHVETIRMQMKLVGKALPPSRIAELPSIIEISGASPNKVSRLFEFRTIEESADLPWISALESTLPEIKVAILERTSVSRSPGYERIYSCSLTAEVPEKVDSISADTIRLMSGKSVVATFRVVVRRRVPWEIFPAVLSFPPADRASDATSSVVVQAVDSEDADSLLRLEIIQVPEGVVVEWLPFDEPRQRRLAVRFLATHRIAKTSTDSILLQDPRSLISVKIPILRTDDEQTTSNQTKHE